MQYFNPMPDPSDKKGEALLFLAQRLWEMVHYETLDSHKLKFHNLESIISEFIETLQLVDEGALDEKNIIYLLEEMKHIFSNNDPAKKIIPNIEDHLTGFIDQPISSQIKTLELIQIVIDHKSYVKSILDEMTRGVLENKWGIIDSNISNYFITAHRYGYSHDHIFKKTKEVFFGKRETTEPELVLVKLIKKFNFSRGNYEVCFECSRKIAVLPELLDAFKCELASDLPSDPWKKSKGDNVFVRVKGVTALDPYSARNFAHDRISTITNLMSLFDHGKREETGMKAFVIQVEKSDVNEEPDDEHDDLNPPIVLHEPKMGINKGFEFNVKSIREPLEKIMSSVNMKNDSFIKIRRAIALHSACINEKSPENALLNLWIALESLVPRMEGRNKIDSIIDSITPFIGVYYLPKQARYISHWMSRIDKEFSDSIYADEEELAAVDKWQALMAVMVINDHSGIWLKILDQFKKHPLMTYRLKQLREKILKGKYVQKSISNHIERVSWQIRRIYRRRNLVVHLGRNDPTTDLLVENLHEYFDLLLEGVAEITMKYTKEMSIDHVIRHASLQWKMYNDLLSKNPESITAANYKEILLPSL